MRKLIFGMNLTLDGYIAAPGDDLGWSAPSDELFQWWLDQELAIGLLMYGRKLWEAMWLDNLDHHYTGMICDVAHLVATAGLQSGDLEGARAAVAAGLLAAPGDVKILTDAVWVAYAEGNEAEGEAYVSALITSCGVDLEEELEVYLSIEEARRTARAC